jgi:hypothetical protein
MDGLSSTLSPSPRISKEKLEMFVSPTPSLFEIFAVLHVEI